MSKLSVRPPWSFLVRLLVAVVALACGANHAGAQTTYIYRRAITIDHRKVANTDQSSFPVLVTGTYSYLATVANGGKVQNTSGYDVISRAMRPEPASLTTRSKATIRPRAR